jgi:hypothetical protein
VAAVAPDDVWAVGSWIEHWNGRTWTAAKAPSPACGTLHAVTAVAATDVWAVGAVATPGGVEQTCIEHWNGKKWSVVASPSPGAQSNFLEGVTAVGPNDVWAVGNYMNTGLYITPSTPEQTLVLHWNGTTWSVVPSPSPSFSAGGAGDSFGAVTAVSGSNLWAVGTTLDPTSGAAETLIERWNGTSWNVVPSPNPSAQNDVLHGVAAVSGSDIWADGQVQDPTSGYPTPLVEQWNGSSWSVVSSPNPGSGSPPGGILRGASVDQGSGQVWAVGFSNTEQTLTELNP